VIKARPHVKVARVAVALLALGAARLAAAQAGGSLASVQLGVSTLPESVTVGDPLELRVRVRAPAGATIAFPDGPDSSAQVQAIASRAVVGAADASGTDRTAVYKLVAWDVGEVPAKLGDVVVTLGGAERRIALGDVMVKVHSVLPADTTLRVPKPPRPPFDVVVPWWQKWLPWILGALALIALLAWWWWRHRRRGGLDASALDAHAFAEREFARIEALGLVDAGERGRYVALMVEVLRDYLALRLPAARASLTSGELLAALSGERSVPLSRLAAILDEADLVKFARRVVTADRARELGREARAVARETEAAIVATATPLAQEKAA
jgi:hypothetical protein